MKMNVQEYIKSGIIEDYCLGVLTPAEMEQVAQQAAIYPEINTEIEAYEMVLKNYAAEFGLVKKSIKQNIFDIIDNIENEDNITIDYVPLINKNNNTARKKQKKKQKKHDTKKNPSLVEPLPGKKGVERFIYWTRADVPYEI